MKTTQAKSVELVNVRVFQDVNKHGESAWMASPVYLRHGVRTSVPDDCGYPTESEARLAAVAWVRCHRDPEFLRESEPVKGEFK